MKDFFAFQLAEVYLKFYKKYTNKTFNLHQIKKTKWWKFFVETIEKFGEEKDFDIHIFIEAQFHEYGKIYPPQLPTKKALETFKMYKQRKSNNSYGKKRTLESLVISYRQIRDWSYENGYNTINIKAFLNNDRNVFLLDEKIINPTVLFFSKTFKEKYSDMFDRNEVENKRAIIYSDDRIKDRVQQMLGEEFY